MKDDWQVRPGLSFGLGVRYDWQNYFHDNNNLAPRVSIAYAPGNGKKNVLRAGIGLFSDRTGPVVIADVLHSQPGGLRRVAGVPRNSLETSAYSSLDLRASRDLTIGTQPAARTITLAFDAFNVLNHVNYSSFVGTVGPPLFAQPVSASSPRQLQFSLRTKF